MERTWISIEMSKRLTIPTLTEEKKNPSNFMFEHQFIEAVLWFRMPKNMWMFTRYVYQFSSECQDLPVLNKSSMAEIKGQYCKHLVKGPIILTF